MTSPTARRAMVALLVLMIALFALAWSAPSANARVPSARTQLAQLIVLANHWIDPCGDEPEELSLFMVRVNYRVVWDARTLSCAIYREARKQALDPAALAAVVWNESWFDPAADGTSGERGYWQLWPGGRKACGWGGLSWSGAQRRSQDVEAATVAAAKLIAVFVGWCRRHHRDHRRPTDPYAHYNSGFRWPRPGYSIKLWTRTQTIRLAVGNGRVTGQELAWLSRQGVQP